jgi:phage terminase small subunit
MGRKRSKRAKVLRGTLRPDRERPAGGGELLTRRPRAPQDLAPAARGPWEELAEAAIAARVLKPATLPVLRVAAEALAMYRRALAAALDGPLTTPGSRGQDRMAPAAASASTWWTRALAALAQLGLTPRAAGLIEPEPAPPVEDEIDKLISHRQGKLPLEEDE